MRRGVRAGLGARGSCRRGGEAVSTRTRGRYNTQHRHSSIGYLSPVEFEKRHESALRESPLENGFQGSTEGAHHVPA